MSDDSETFEANARVVPTTRDVAAVLLMLSKKRSPAGHYAQIVLACVVASCMFFLIGFPLVVPPPRPHDTGAVPYVLLALCFVLSPIGRHHAQALFMKAANAGMYAPYTIVRFTKDAMTIDERGRVRDVPFAAFTAQATTKRAFALVNASGAPERVVPMAAFTDARTRDAFAAVMAGSPPARNISEVIETFGASDEGHDIRFVLTLEESIAAMRIVHGEGWYQFFRAVLLLVPIAALAHAFIRSGPLVGALTSVFLSAALLFAWVRTTRGNAARTVHVALGDALTVRSVAGSRSWTWTELEGRVENDSLVVMFVGAHRGIAIPKRALGGRALALLRARVPMKS